MSDEPDLSLGEARLWRLIAERSRHGADTEAIDARIWRLYGERWAIMFTDLAGFSRYSRDFGILHFLEVIHDKRRLLLPVVEAHDGVVIKLEADSFLLLFRDPIQALDCAVAMRAATWKVNARRQPEERILLCVGLGYGDVLRVGTTDVWGREVNGASKLGEDAAETDEILMTDAFRQAVEGQRDLDLKRVEGVAAAPRAWSVVG